ncbi:hypothetical protein [Methylobacterium soli]|uniref:Uncharacterized protein n=1 Tax=Methylobacterium soli TaxID=553447 RepID=A0A6L3SX25_9HYPH|nr:hypothetical protein [Methylobacterium soli]KAB1077902.1 hypothetical protein F6X53_16980 [Methylobacterium soli]
MGSKVPPAKAPKMEVPEGREHLRETGAAGRPDAAAQGHGGLDLSASLRLTQSRDTHLLRLIAETLGMSASAFLSPGAPGNQASPAQEAAGECGELIRAYLRISDPNERRRYLELIRIAGNRA